MRASNRLSEDTIRIHVETMMPSKANLTYECRRELAESIRFHCPCANENSELLRVIFEIVDRELRRTRRCPLPTDSPANSGHDGGAA